MDKDLKDDIAKEFRQEYFVAEKKKEGRLWQAFHKFNRGIDRAFRKIGFDGSSGVFLTCVALFAFAPHAGIAAACLWAADALTAAVSNIACRTRAEDAIWKDIENGSLPARYNEVLDGKIKGLSGQLDHYTAQKAQLPVKGAVAEAFAAATAEVPVPVAAVPAAAPQAAPPKP